MKFKYFLFGLGIVFSLQSSAAEKQTIRIGVQAGGTVEWELSALEDGSQAKAQSFNLEIQRLANAEAGKIALQAGAVDMIVSDWIWVSKLRSTGADFTFYPYSTTSGALIVPENSPIRSIKDLKGKRLGIAGGELDKNWLLLQALAKQNQLDLNSSVDKTYGAPPLISEQIKRKRVDAALTYWHFAARLETRGYRQIIDGKGILKGLGVEEAVPSLGYVFNRGWAISHQEAVNDFLKAGNAAQKKLCSDEASWKKIIPLTKTEDLPTQNKLRQRYCEGVIKQWGGPEQQAAGRIYTLLRGLSNNKLTGQSETLHPGTFWLIE